MTLHGIVAALGGDLYHGGQRASVPAPGHSAADRSVSLLLSDGRVIAHGFGSADWRAVLDMLRTRGLIDPAGRPCGADRPVGAMTSAPARPDRRLRLAAASALWEGGRPLSRGYPAERHLRRRSVGLPVEALGDLASHPAAPVSVYRRAVRTRAALLAAVRDGCGALTAVEITYLEPSGLPAAGLRLPRKTIGFLPAGCAVRLADPGPVMVVGEGVFTTLAAMERFALPGWACLAAHNLARWMPPDGVRSVLIAADRGPVGEHAAARLRDRLRAGGLQVRIGLPPAAYGDWNEAAEWVGGESQGEEGRRDGGNGPMSARSETAR